MSITPRRLVTPERRQRENRLIATTLAFIAIGPPIGMLTLISLINTDELLSGKSIGLIELLMALGDGFLYAPLSYLFGAIPAGIAGALVGYLSISDRFSWWLILLIGFVVGCLFFAQYFLFPIGGPAGTKFNLALAKLAAAHIAICLVPTILCTAIVRHYERKWCRSPKTTADMVHDH